MVEIPEVPKDWYLTFFDELYYETYRPREGEDRNREEAEFIAEALDLPQGSRLLDIGCGYARHAVYLAAMGYRVVGVDVSDYLLRVAEERVREFGVEVELVRADMRELEYDGEFDGAYMFYTTFGYFDHEGNVEALRRAVRALRPGGRLLIDVVNKYRAVADLVRERGEARRWWSSGGYVVLESSVLDVEEDALVAVRTFIRGGSVVATRGFRLRLYSYCELKAMLLEAGARPLRAYGDYRRSPYTASSPRLVVVAERVA